MLRDALLSLVIERGYESVTVQDIAERAGVGRSTFYTHFRDKQDLLLSEAEWAALARELKGAAAAASGADPLAFTLAFFRHVDGYRQVFRAIAGGAAGSLVQMKLRKVLKTTVRNALSMHRRGAQRGVPLEPAVEYVVGALLSLTMWWIEQKPRTSPEDINGIFHRLLAGFVEPGVCKTAD